MNIKFKINKTNYVLISDKRNWIYYPVGKPKEKAFFSTIGGLLEDLYQSGLKDNEVTTFRDLARHSGSVRQQIIDIENKFSLGTATR